MAIAEFEAKARTEFGSGPSRREREDGWVPAVIYGHKETPAHVGIRRDEISAALRGHAHMCRLSFDGKSEQVVIKDVQFDYLGDTVIHVDFLRVDMNEAIEVPVTVLLDGHAKGVASGGILEQMMVEVTVRCTPDKIPALINLRVDDLDLHDAIRTGDLELPEGVEAVGDPKAIVVTVVGRGKKGGVQEESDEEGEGEGEEPKAES